MLRLHQQHRLQNYQECEFSEPTSGLGTHNSGDGAQKFIVLRFLKLTFKNHGSRKPGTSGRLTQSQE